MRRRESSSEGDGSERMDGRSGREPETSLGYASRVRDGSRGRATELKGP